MKFRLVCNYCDNKWERYALSKVSAQNETCTKCKSRDLKVYKKEEYTFNTYEEDDTQDLKDYSFYDTD